MQINQAKISSCPLHFKDSLRIYPENDGYFPAFLRLFINIYMVEKDMKMETKDLIMQSDVNRRRLMEIIYKAGAGHTGGDL